MGLWQVIILSSVLYSIPKLGTNSYTLQSNEAPVVQLLSIVTDNFPERGLFRLIAFPGNKHNE